MPDYAALTDALLRRAFPGGLSDPDYLGVLRVLGPHMSQRNLAEVVSDFTGRDPSTVINDVLGVDGKHIEAAVIGRVERALSDAGL